MSTDPDLAREVCALIDARRFHDALPLARRWASADPENWAAHADLNVVAKIAGSFDESRRAGLRAIELGGDRVGTGLHWNLGIAATALGDWKLARRSWGACGVNVPPGDGAIAWSLGPTPIRVGGPGAYEVVWSDRICPARAILRNVPLPESGRRFGDVVLHDGEPRGRRKLGDRSVAVFDELALLERSPFPTRILVVEADAPEDVESLLASLSEHVERAEDWSASLTWHCERCSQGETGEHDHRAGVGWSRERQIGFASREDIGDELLLRWESSGSTRRVLRIEQVDESFERGPG